VVVIHKFDCTSVFLNSKMLLGVNIKILKIGVVIQIVNYHFKIFTRPKQDALKVTVKAAGLIKLVQPTGA